MSAQLSDCQWPDLAGPYQQALREAVEHLLSRFAPVGIVASGSIIRGNPGPSSDFDIVVIHKSSTRQRIQKFFQGVPTELFVNPPQQIRRYFEEEHSAGRPCTAHMLTTGFVVLERDPVVQALCHEAQTWLQKPLGYDENRLTWLRYAVVDDLDNAMDICDNDPANAAIPLSRAMQAMVQYVFFARGRFLPRLKEMLVRLGEVDSELERLARAYYGAATIEEQVPIALEFAQYTVGATTFFEWESVLEEVQDRD